MRNTHGFQQQDTQTHAFKFLPQSLISTEVKMQEILGVMGILLFRSLFWWITFQGPESGG